MNVYVVNHTEQDLSAANKFGKLVYLTEGVQNVFHIENMLSTMKEKLVDAEDGDYLLLCGSPILNIIASLVFITHAGKLNVLIFNAKTRAYTPRTLTEHQITGGL